MHFPCVSNQTCGSTSYDPEKWRKKYWIKRIPTLKSLHALLKINGRQSGVDKYIRSYNFPSNIVPKQQTAFRVSFLVQKTRYFTRTPDRRKEYRKFRSVEIIRQRDLFQSNDINLEEKISNSLFVVLTISLGGARDQMQCPIVSGAHRSCQLC